MEKVVFNNGVAKIVGEGCKHLYLVVIESISAFILIYLRLYEVVYFIYS